MCGCYQPEKCWQHIISIKKPHQQKGRAAQRCLKLHLNHKGRERERRRLPVKINKEANIYIPGLRAVSCDTSQAGIKQEILRRRFQRQGMGACRDRVGLNKSYPAVMFITWIITKIKCFIWERDSSDPSLAACLNHIHNPCQHHPTLQSWWRFGCCLNFVSSCAWLQFSFCRHHFLPCFIQPSLAASFHESLIVRESPEGRIS